MSCMPTTAPVSIASRQASRRSFSMKGSPTCTLGRFCSASSLNSSLAIVAPHQAQRKSIYQRILRVAVFELGFAAKIWHSEAVTVMGDAANHALENRVILVDRRFVLVCVPGDRAEAERVHYSDRPGAHGEDVAK